jgi:hypothetical protein
MKKGWGLSSKRASGFLLTREKEQDLMALHQPGSRMIFLRPIPSLL